MLYWLVVLELTSLLGNLRAFAGFFITFKQNITFIIFPQYLPILSV